MIDRKFLFERTDLNHEKIEPLEITVCTTDLIIIQDYKKVPITLKKRELKKVVNYLYSINKKIW